MLATFDYLNRSINLNNNVVVVGLGYVGLPLAHALIDAGGAVVGLDTNSAIVGELNAGRSHVDDLSDHVIRSMLSAGFRATTDPEVLATARTIVICVPTPLSAEGGPDLSAVKGAVRQISPRLRVGATVILESTTYPGTTDEIVRPMLEEGSGLVAGKDFHLAFSPERIDPGNAQFGPKNTPKVVGGLTADCTRAAVAFYSGFIDVVVPTSGTREAEMAKLLENTYRHINIALVNEMARFCNDLGVDIWEVIAAARTKPFGFQAFYPGPGVGGHCIPIDPNYLSHTVKSKLGYPFRFVELAEEINRSMPIYVVDRVQQLLNDVRKPLNGSTVLLLGVTYKADIADQRESPAVPLAQAFVDRGAEIWYSDPHVADWTLGPVAAQRKPEPSVAAAEADVVVLLQAHAAFDLRLVAANSRILFDTRGVCGGEGVYSL